MKSADQTKVELHEDLAQTQVVCRNQAARLYAQETQALAREKILTEGEFRQKEIVAETQSSLDLVKHEVSAVCSF